MSAEVKRDLDVAGRWGRSFAGAVAAVAAALLMFSANDAQAAPNTSTRTPYQAYLLANCPSGSNFCRFEGENVPPRGLLEIQRVACQGWHINTMPPSFSVIVELKTAADAFVRRIDFLKTSYTTTSWGAAWAISEQTLMFIPADHRMEISLNSGTVGVGSYGCTVSGYLTVS